MARTAYTRLLAQLDRMETEANELLAGPTDAELAVRAEELREMIVEMRAKVEERLDLGG